MQVRLKVTFVPEVGEGGSVCGWSSELIDPTDDRLRRELSIMEFAARNMRDRCIVDGNATAAGMNRLLDGKDVKDTVEYK